MPEIISKFIITADGEDQFEMRLLKDEGVGLLTTHSGKHYLMLDSLDYWYDLIQNGYPKKRKCRCKNDWFNVTFKYEPREGTDDICSIAVISTCTACGKQSEAMAMDIDYSPTAHLIEQPLVPCEKPNIKYRLTELNGYWTEPDRADVLQFLAEALQLKIYCWYWDNTNKKRTFEQVNLSRALELVQQVYLSFYFTRGDMVASEVALMHDKGVYLKDGLWRRAEIIELSAPIHMSQIGLLYYLRFCTQYLDKGEALDKSAEFLAITEKFTAWLQSQFVNQRGKNCLDSPAMLEKVMKKDTEKDVK